MPQAILSVHDKTGLVEFARGLNDLGWKLIASGGTARLLRENGLPVTEVADYTGSPEILGGRVKTLHPAVHAGLLARATDADRDQLEKLGWDYIDLVAVNLYPFEQTVAKPGVTLEEAIENIDIGGVTLIRAAAKNHDRVTLLCDPGDYSKVLNELKAGEVSAETRRCLALKGFEHTTHYDAAISQYLSSDKAFTLETESGHLEFGDGERGAKPPADGNLQSSYRMGGGEVGNVAGVPLELKAYPVMALRYGENPHQKAELYSFEPGGGPLGGRVLQGKELSYTNLLDLDGAWKAAVSFERPSVCIVKHVSPCGIASDDNLDKAFRLALASDPVSAYGGVVAANRTVDEKFVDAMGDLFVECIAAPGFSDQAHNLLAKRKNCRLLEMPDLEITPRYEVRTITRGLLRQEIDFGDPQENEWKVISERQPTEAELKALRFAWNACRHVKSNSIVFAVGEATVGIGGGQPNRVDCVRIAAQRAGEKSKGAVMASDAFFPFPDSVEVAAQAGITAIVHPGGSIRDAESIAIANKHGIAMVTTGYRHFKH